MLMLPEGLFGVVNSWKQSSSFLVRRWDGGEVGGDWTIPQTSARPCSKNGVWAGVTLLLFIPWFCLHPPLLRGAAEVGSHQNTLASVFSPSSSFWRFCRFSAHPSLSADQGRFDNGGWRIFGWCSVWSGGFFFLMSTSASGLSRHPVSDDKRQTHHHEDETQSSEAYGLDLCSGQQGLLLLRNDSDVEDSR